MTDDDFTKIPEIDIEITSTPIKAKSRRIGKKWRIVRYKDWSFEMFYVPWYWMFTPQNWSTYFEYRKARRKRG